MPAQSAFKTVDEIYKGNERLLKVDEAGIPRREILVDLEVKDISAFWLLHERKLWIITFFCAVYFATIMWQL